MNEIHDLAKKYGRDDLDVKKKFDEYRELRVPPDNHWTWDGSAFYAFTVITTIGYGSYTPQTVAGRTFTVIYALLGLGVASAFLSAVGENSLDLIRFVYKRSMGVSSANHHFLIVNVALLLFVCIAVVFYALTEEWNFFESWYFLFVSITTVGFGDLIPGHHLYVSCVVMLIGLSLCAAWLEGFDELKKSTTNKLLHFWDTHWDFSSKHFLRSELVQAGERHSDLGL